MSTRSHFVHGISVSSKFSIFETSMSFWKSWSQTHAASKWNAADASRFRIQSSSVGHPSTISSTYAGSQINKRERTFPSSLNQLQNVSAFSAMPENGKSFTMKAQKLRSIDDGSLLSGAKANKNYLFRKRSAQFSESPSSSILSNNHSITWTNGAEYNEGDVIFHFGNWYICTQNHTSNFDQDPSPNEGIWVQFIVSNVSTTLSPQRESDADKPEIDIDSSERDIKYLGHWYSCKQNSTRSVWIPAFLSKMCAISIPATSSTTLVQGTASSSSMPPILIASSTLPRWTAASQSTVNTTGPPSTQLKNGVTGGEFYSSKTAATNVQLGTTPSVYPNGTIRGSMIISSTAAGHQSSMLVVFTSAQSSTSKFSTASAQVSILIIENFAEHSLTQIYICNRQHHYKAATT